MPSYRKTLVLLPPSKVPADIDPDKDLRIAYGEKFVETLRVGLVINLQASGV